MSAPMTEQGTPTVTGTTDEACPYCGTTTGVAPTPSTSPRVKAWSCTACRTDWAITTVYPQPYSDRLAATVEQLGATRSVLRVVITLASDSATLPGKARRAQRPLALTVQDPEASRCPAKTPAGRRFERVRPEHSPGSRRPTGSNP